MKDPSPHAEPIIDAFISFFWVFRKNDDRLCRSAGVAWLAHQRADMFYLDLVCAFDIFFDFIDVSISDINIIFWCSVNYQPIHRYSYACPCEEFLPIEFFNHCSIFYAVALDLDDVLGSFPYPLNADIMLPLCFQAFVYVFLKQLCEVLLI
jgi:hypothetical protein